MKSSLSCMAIIAAILLLASCSSFQQPFAQLRPLEEGEARLTAIEMPDYVREGLDYDVILRFNSDETPQIRRVCFRWISEQISSPSPSLNCYAANGDFGTGNVCSTQTTVSGADSSSFCVEGAAIRTDVPGRVVVRIRPAGLQGDYNKLVGQVEYIYDGQLRTTNAVKTTVAIDRE